MNYRFMIGCNYWASNAGADMWKCYDGDCVREDLSVLASQGIEYIRVFPNWRDFQPVMPLYAGRGVLAEYCLEGEREATNPYYLDEGMLDKFADLLDICWSCYRVDERSVLCSLGSKREKRANRYRGALF